MGYSHHVVIILYRYILCARNRFHSNSIPKLVFGTIGIRRSEKKIT